MPGAPIVVESRVTILSRLSSLIEVAGKLYVQVGRKTVALDKAPDKTVAQFVKDRMSEWLEEGE
jgi:hypothetical protein